MKPTTITIRRPDDFHVHLREGFMMPQMLMPTAKDFARSLVMPNTYPPVLDAAGVERYRRQIKAADRWRHEPLMTIKLTAATTPAVIRAAKAAGAIAAKLYPEGATTNSEDGIRDFDALGPVLAAMQEEGMVLCLHGEAPEAEVLDRERVFLPVAERIAKVYPRLKIALEHISTAEAVDLVRSLPNMAATITAHHLVLTLDDVIGGLLDPHNFCKPIPKTRKDRRALITAATSGDPKYFFGSDSAPHPKHKKEGKAAPAGIFSAPVALPLLAGVFEEAGALDALESFTSENGAAFYGLPENFGTTTLVHEPWRVPGEYAGVVPFMAGKTIPWRVRA